MVRRITVSCVTATPMTTDETVPLETLVERTIALWDRRLSDVLPDQPDIIVLPEYADRPSTECFGPQRQVEYYAHRGPRIRDHFARIAADNGCYIAYTSAFPVEGHSANCMQIIDRMGRLVGSYEKTHVTMGENEAMGLQYGVGPQCFDLDFGRVGCAICFDLNFDGLRAAYADANLDLLLFSSVYHGGLMQNYWAYTLRAYLAACIRPPAPSAILSPVGEVLRTSTNYFPHVTESINLDYKVVHLDGNWEKLAAAKKKYGREIAVRDPGRVGAVTLTSESRNVTAADIVEEFKIELLDDYFRRCRVHRLKALGRSPNANEPAYG